MQYPVDARGSLLIIGGREDKEDERMILRALAKRVGSGKLVVVTVATNHPKEVGDQYDAVFRRLGVKHVHKLHVDEREEAKSERIVRVLDDAKGVFFTGGDQLKITSQLGDTPIYERVREIFESGGIIAGTSAGASVMSETMLVSGGKDGSARIGRLVQMAPGFGLIRDMIIDQHFAERGRVSRLLGAVVQNPRSLGIGIDEDTAILVEQGRLRVLGTGAVTVIDGRRVSYSNLTEAGSDRTLSAHDVTLHLLSAGDSFDLRDRRPRNGPAEDIEAEFAAR